MDECLNFKKNAIEELGIEESVFDELLRCFVPEAQVEIQKLDEAIKADNFDEIGRLSHGLKGMAGNLRITPMYDAAKAIETIARQAGRDKQAIMEKVIELKQGLAGLKQLI